MDVGIVEDSDREANLIVVSDTNSGARVITLTEAKTTRTRSRLHFHLQPNSFFATLKDFLNFNFV